MKEEYYFLFNNYDKIVYLSAVTDIVPGRNIPVQASSLSFPYHLEKIEESNIYLNFDEYETLNFDYRENDGHIFSECFLSVISTFKSPPKIVKPLSIWMEGKEQPPQFYYIAFYRGKWEKGNQLDEDFVFYDREKSVYALGRLKELVPIGEIVLTDRAKQYDYFQLLETHGLSRFIVINERVKEALEKAALKGFKIVPLQEGFAEYCKTYRVSLEGILPKVKKRIP